MNKNTAWNFSDAWLLHAMLVACSGVLKPISLRQIIGCGDYINHSILEYAEIKSGLEKLIAAGYAEIRDNEIYITDNALNELIPLLTEHSYAGILTKAIESFLNRKYFTQYGSVIIPSGLINEDTVRKAYTDYFNNN